MPFFDDFAQALEDYPSDSVTLSIVDLVAQSPSTPVSVNIDEVWVFQVRVANNGHINMTNVSLHVDGENGALVSTAPLGPFLSGITFGALTISGGGTQDTVNLYFRAPSVVKPAGTTMVTAHIGNWYGNLNHMFDNHTLHAPTPQGTYSTQVFP